MHVTIHIGTYKTATSAIQYALARSGRTLARVGAKYASAGLNVALSKHLHLFDRIIDGGYNRQRHLTHRDEDYIGQLLQELRDPAVEHLLISEEELSYPSPAVAQYLAPLRAEADVEVVIVVRRQPEFMESLYLQFLKEPLRRMTYSFSDFLDDPEYSPRGDFAALLEPWEEVFGRDAITVVDFDDLRNGDVVVNFANLVGLPRNLQTPEHAINPSVTPASGELLRLLGKANPDFPRMQLAGILKELQPGEGTTLLVPEIVDRILTSYRDSNRRLAERFGVDLDKATSLSKKPVDQSELNAQALEAAAEILALVWVRTRRVAAAIQDMSNQQAAALETVRSLFKPAD